MAKLMEWAISFGETFDLPMVFFAGCFFLIMSTSCNISDAFSRDKKTVAFKRTLSLRSDRVFLSTASKMKIAKREDNMKVYHR
jgi:hypothetical protein